MLFPAFYVVPIVLVVALLLAASVKILREYERGGRLQARPLSEGEGARPVVDDPLGSGNGPRGLAHPGSSRYRARTSSLTTTCP